MNTDPRSTNEVRIIAQEAAREQNRVCAVERDRIEDKLLALAGATADNTKAIEELSKLTASLSATASSLVTTAAGQSETLTAHGTKIAGHDTKLAVLTVRVAIAAVIGGTLPDIAQWLIRVINP